MIEKSLMSGYGVLKLKHSGARVRVYSPSSLVERGAELEVDCGAASTTCFWETNHVGLFRGVVEYRKG